MIKKLLYFTLILGLISCKKESSFADSIILHHEKNEKLTFQKFNEGIGEGETGLIYVGKDTSNVKVKYYNSMIPAPPPPPGTEVESKPARNAAYFHGYFERMKFSKTPISFDSLSQNNVKIVIKPNDTIPKYAYNSETGTLKKYKAFPVFIKNISNRKLILSGLKNLPLAILNDKQKWQMIWNDDALICGTGWGMHYWEFEPNEIMIFSVNYLTGKDRGKFKVTLFDSSSESFMMNYDKNILKVQRRYGEVK